MIYKEIKGIIFDYGGTLDTDARHWAYVIWDAYKEAGVPISEERFREAYVFGERELAKAPIIAPEDNFLSVMQKKINLETVYLSRKGYWKISEADRKKISNEIATISYNKAKRTTSFSATILEKLKEDFSLALVSNFYGNIKAVLADFGLLSFFPSIIESASVGVRKPDPRIFELGIESLKLKPSEIMVIGDSYEKDIAPAIKAGCKTAWIKGQSWKENEEFINSADYTISSLGQLIKIIYDTN